MEEDYVLDMKLLGRALVKNIMLFVISVLLVLGFYYHQYFYNIGLYGLIVVGGIITFLVIKLGAWINSTGVVQMYDGVLLFEPEEASMIQNGLMKQTIRKVRHSRIRKGHIIRAKLNLESDMYFAELIVTGVEEKTLGEITDEDAYLAGRNNKKSFRKYWEEKHGGYDDSEKVRIIKFRVL